MRAGGGVNHRFDLASALAAYTSGSAWVNHLDDVTGSVGEFGVDYWHSWMEAQEMQLIEGGIGGLRMPSAREIESFVDPRLHRENRSREDLQAFAGEDREPVGRVAPLREGEFLLVREEDGRAAAWDGGRFHFDDEGRPVAVQHGLRWYDREAPSRPTGPYPSGPLT